MPPHARRRLPRTLYPNCHRRRGRDAGRSLRLEPLERRTVLSFVSFPVVADGLVADRDSNGTFETVDTTSTSISDRWFNIANIGQERGVFEFDLRRIAPGTPILSATVGFTVNSYTFSGSSYPQAVFRVAPGDGVVKVADATAPASSAGTGTVASLGYNIATLDPAAFQAAEGGFASLRLENSALNAKWFDVASNRDTLRQAAMLTLEIPTAPPLSLSIAPGTVSESAGAAAATATLTRKGDLGAPLTVNLASGDTGRATVPATATFAAGQSSASFAVGAVDDQVYTGNGAVTVSAAATVANPFGLDASFGAGGLAPTTWLSFRDQFPRAPLAIQADGKILAASQYLNDSWRIIRLNPNGSVDPSFGNGGETEVKFPVSTSTYPEPHRIVVQADGKILVGGEIVEGPGAAALCRLTANGQLDATFGSGGIADLSGVALSTGASVDDIAVRPNGQILLALDNSGTVFFRVAQLQPDGSVDTSFGSGGVTPQLVSAPTAALELLPDGRILVAGFDKMARFNADGKALDPTFGSGGSVAVSFGGRATNISALALDSAGRIVVAGSAKDPSDGLNDMAAARFTTNGAVDATFGSGGSTVVDVGGHGHVVTSLAVLPDDRIIVAGLAVTSSSDYDSAMVGLTASGAPDPTFGNGNGRYQQSLIPKTDLIYDLALQPANGKPVALTGWIGDMRVARFNLAAPPAVSSASAQVTVLDNDSVAPIAAAGSFVTTAGVAYSGTVTASDSNGDPLTYAAVALPAHGTLSLAADGSFTYAPAPGYHGPDGFTFKANDGRLDSNVATVSIVVNAPPVAANDSYIVDQNAVLKATAPGVLGNDGDPDGDALAALLATGPAYGTLTLGRDGSFTYTPAADYFGPDSFTYKANDGRLDSAPATVSILVDAPPVAVRDTYSVAENQVLTVTAPAGVLANDADPNGGPITAKLLTGPAHGALALSADGSFTYTPAADYSGPDSFTYQADDGRLTGNVATAALTVRFVNHAPGFTSGADQAVDEDAGPQSVAGWATAISAGRPSEAGQPLNFVVSVDNPVLFAVGPAVAPDGTLTYTPGPDASGSATVTVRLHDGGGTDDGGADTSPPQVFTITVNPVNDAPVFHADNPPAVDEGGGPQSVPAWALAGPGGGASEAGQALTYLVSGISNPALFAVAPAVAPDGTLTYTLAPDASGISSFDVRVRDNGGTDRGGVDTSAAQTFTIAVNFVNNVPSFVRGADQTVKEGSGAHVVPGWATAITAGSPAEAGQALDFVISAGSSGLFAAGPAVTPDGTLTYTLADNAFGTAKIGVRLHDNGGTDHGGADLSDPQVLTITVVQVAHAPSLTVGPVSGSEAAPIPLNVAAATTNTTGTETLVIQIGGVPAGSLLSAGTNLGGGAWSLTPAQLPGLTITSPDNAAFTLSVTATATAAASGDVASSNASLPVTVLDARPGAGIVGDSSGVRGQPRNFTFGAADTSAIDRAAGFTFRINWGDRSPVQVIPPGRPALAAHTFAAAGNYTVQVTAVDKDGGVSLAATRRVAITTIALQPDPFLRGRTDLVVGGTTGNDAIAIARAGGSASVLNVTVGGRSLGNFAAPAGSSLARVLVYGQAGNDAIKVAGDVAIPAWLFGGDGNDNLTGGGGNDVVLSGNGNDAIAGSGGRDLLIGGAGADRVDGGLGEDLLVSGATVYDANEAALAAILAEWTSSRSATARRRNLAGVGTGGRANGRTFLVARATVADDHAADLLTVLPRQGPDWVFDNPPQDKRKTR